MIDIANTAFGCPVLLSYAGYCGKYSNLLGVTTLKVSESFVREGERDQNHLCFLSYFSSGRPQKGQDTRKDELLLHASANGTSQKSISDVTEQCDNDVMDCLVSFYGDVP